MKRFTILAMFVAMVLSVSAQYKMHVWEQGVKTTFVVSTVDSVTFENYLDDSEDPKDDVYEGIGVFSVSATKQVTFSPGNLQYTQSTNTWSFAKNQYDYIGTDNVTGGSVSSNQYGDKKSGTALADKVDMFGWSTAATNFGVSTSMDNNDYSGSFVDWGTNKIGNDAPNTWRTLTYDEWYYILESRKNAPLLRSQATVNDVYGYVLLPDSFEKPEDINWSHQANNWTTNTYTAEQWKVLEATGAIFLSAAGRRDSSYVGLVQGSGFYWSSTDYYSEDAYFLCDGHMYSFDRYSGVSVRLVKDVEGETTNTENGYEYVDLGLSVKWATCNVGASKPEEYGDYFAWGETEPKDYYDWSTYKWCNGSYNTLTKYNNSSSYGTVDNKTVLDKTDDAAAVNWGGSWRMPTDTELTELRENCTWTQTTQEGVNGYKVTSKKNGNTIFLPAAGYRDGSSLYSAGSIGDFWSRSLDTGSPRGACRLYFYSDYVGWYYYDRYYGFTVRPVCQ